MEIGKKYKIVYLDNNYTKIASGRVLSVDDFFIHLEEIREGNVWIGKRSIIKILEIGDEYGRT